MSLAALLLTGATTTTATAPAAAASKALTFNVGLAPGADPKALFQELGIDLHGTPEWIPGLGAVRADLEYDDFSALMDKLEKPHPAIRYAEREQVVDLDASERRTLTGRELQTVRMPRGKSGSEQVTVAVLDTGVTPNRDLPKDRLVPGYDATRLPFVGLEDLPLNGSTEDEAGFGTMVAGIVAGDSGACPACRIMPVKVANEYQGSLVSLSAAVAAGIVWAADHGADVITTPAVVESNTNLISEAVRYALDRDVLIVASAGGNIYNERSVYPAATEPVLAVSAVDTAGRVTGRYGSDKHWVDVAAAEGAPAVNHLGESSQLDGVEGATAVVAGTAALALSTKPGATAAEVREAIVGTAAAAGLPVLNAAGAVHQVAGNDTAAPKITSTGLTAEQLISKPIDVRPAVTDDYGIEKVELTAGGRTVTTRYPWQTLRYTPPAGFQGRLAVTLRVTDVAGRTSSATTVVRVDTAGPAATVNPKQNTRVRGTFTTSLTGVADASGVAKAELWANGKYLGTGYSKSVATGRTSGNVTLTWKLTDKLGNTRTYTRTVIADNKAPSVSITKAPKHKAKVKGTVKVSAKASDASGIARVELLVNGKVVATDKTAGYVLSVNTAKQKKTMKVRVRAYDKLGNVAYTSTRTWYRK